MIGATHHCEKKEHEVDRAVGNQSQFIEWRWVIRAEHDAAFLVGRLVFVKRVQALTSILCNLASTIPADADSAEGE